MKWASTPKQRIYTKNIMYSIIIVIFAIVNNTIESYVKVLLDYCFEMRILCENKRTYQIVDESRMNSLQVHKVVYGKEV